jgi:hypothetical protein
VAPHAVFVGEVNEVAEWDKPAENRHPFRQLPELPPTPLSAGSRGAETSKPGASIKLTVLPAH